ncbi:type VII secretion target [Amycolatopsis suaedae]|uniref:ESX-1 secretion-associated protein n=1 Tax=Amycolatopsis suaedae TaxID=2510978 RepID=A0A4V2ELS5_9PSEU|nr:type VII secretion target [Amycolatopsis suaedae]RZQ62585.1 ESX-1 secretion-associated protein [Amycolatopsis suaedae]
MSAGYEVRTDDLTAHASHLDGLVDRLETASDAAKTVSMSDQAYGLICQFVPPFVNPMEEKGMEVIKAASEGVQALAENVRAAVTVYDEQETGYRKVFDKTLVDGSGPAGK